MRQFQFTALCLSLAATIGLVGCSKDSGDTGKPAAAAHEHGHEHAHAEEGPHKGQLIELGEEEFHAELVHDDAAQKITIYLLDGKATKATPIAASEIVVNLVVKKEPIQFTLPAVPQAGEAAGQSSRFELADKKLSDAMDVDGTTGRFNVTINGKPYVGKITHEHHEHK